MNPLTMQKRSALADTARLSNIRVASACPTDWEKMVGDDRKRHCAECNLNVYNLSAMTERQVQELIACSRGKRLCARFYRRADGTVLTQDCPWSLRALKRRASRMAAAIVAAMMSVNIALGKGKSQQVQQQTTPNGQAERGVSVLVMDQSGAVVSAAEVHLSGPNGKEVVAKTNTIGALLIPPLPSGTYQLIINARGFLKFSNQIVLREDKLEVLKATLKVGGEMVVVGIIVAEESLVQTEVTVSTTFEGKMLDVPSSTVGPNRGVPSPLR